MAANATAQWYVRVSGNNTNGGAFDPGMSGAGINFADQDSPTLVLSSGNGNLISCAQNSTTITSAGTPFLPAHVGNTIFFNALGTNFVQGPYFITSYVSSSQVTLDRSPATAGAGSNGAGSLGGALASLKGVISGPSNAASQATQLVAGNTVWVQGAGTDNPSSPDYTIAAGYFDTAPTGGSGSGTIKLKGYNGRPFIRGIGLLFYAFQGWHFEHLKLSQTGAANGNYLIDLGTRVSIHDCYWDQNGLDFGFAKCWSLTACLLDNTGSTAVGTLAVVFPAALNGGAFVVGNRFRNLRYRALQCTNGGAFDRNIFQGITSDGLYIPSGPTPAPMIVRNNVFYGCAGSGIRIDDTTVPILQYLAMQNNIFVANGAYGINVSGGSAASNDIATSYQPDYNAFYGNTSGERNNLSAGSHSITLSGDPFTSSSTGDFSLNSTTGAGAACKGIGFPTTFPG